MRVTKQNDNLTELGDITSATFEITGEEAFPNGGTAVCYHTGNVTTFYIEATVAAGLTSGASYDLGTLPEGYRPSRMYRKRFIYGYSGQSTWGGLLDIYTSGRMVFWPIEVSTSESTTMRAFETFI